MKEPLMCSDCHQVPTGLTDKWYAFTSKVNAKGNYPHLTSSCYHVHCLSCVNTFYERDDLRCHFPNCIYNKTPSASRENITTVVFKYLDHKGVYQNFDLNKSKQNNPLSFSNLNGNDFVIEELSSESECNNLTNSELPNSKITPQRVKPFSLLKLNENSRNDLQHYNKDLGSNSLVANQLSCPTPPNAEGECWGTESGNSQDDVIIVNEFPGTTQVQEVPCGEEPKWDTSTSQLIESDRTVVCDGSPNPVVTQFPIASEAHSVQQQRRSCQIKPNVSERLSKKTPGCDREEEISLNCDSSKQKRRRVCKKDKISLMARTAQTGQQDVIPASTKLPFKCDKCNKSYKHERSLNSHKKRTHDRHDKASGLCNSEECKGSSWTYADYPSLLRHMRLKHGVKGNAKVLDFNLSKHGVSMRKLFGLKPVKMPTKKCHYCDKHTFVTEQGRKRHEEKDHAAQFEAAKTVNKKIKIPSSRLGRSRRNAITDTSMPTTSNDPVSMQPLMSSPGINVISVDNDIQIQSTSTCHNSTSKGRVRVPVRDESDIRENTQETADDEYTKSSSKATQTTPSHSSSSDSPMICIPGLPNDLLRCQLATDEASEDKYLFDGQHYYELPVLTRIMLPENTTMKYSSVTSGIP